ncbi:hypothetical protein [Paenibacillus ehimensis]|uniref:hypothetical protein n=1 Tax=Paenibacillus ehimensis TaxID=79264 RepID=UPI001267AE59|nr:hypothetical protein [Paenibacillus ehimensis]
MAGENRRPSIAYPGWMFEGIFIFEGSPVSVFSNPERPLFIVTTGRNYIDVVMKNDGTVTRK